MNLLEFKRRLMTDPRNRDPEFGAARERVGEYAALAAESDDFEARLQRALDVPTPDHMAERIIRRQRTEFPPVRGGLRPYLAAAAGLMLAVALTTFVVFDTDAPGHDIQSHIAWHWQTDGPQTIATSRATPSDNNQVLRIFSELGVHLDSQLLEQVRLTKFCPTPDSAGAHVVLATDEGPVTLFYMPRTRVPEAPMSVHLPDGMEGWVVNLTRGSMALVAETGLDTPALAETIKRQLSFPPGLEL